MYRFYVQPQINVFTGALIGYEMLIRKYAKGWQVPQDFASIPISDQINLLKEIGTELMFKVDSLSFNLNKSQFVNEIMAKKLIETQKQIYPITLVVELTEECGKTVVRKSQVKKFLECYLKSGIELSIDDVSTKENTYDKIKWLLPFAAEVKFPMQNLRSEKRALEIPEKLIFWRRIAQKFGLRLIVEGVETAADDEFLNALDIPLRQGFYYEKPHLFEKSCNPK
ncbi:diguanylate cyclase phosphodiesterase domain-containing protein [Liquorilactobacillus aquaticus DSM 21051]|uniref:Diguanylate cyclase phosphodiesterase domain-containing protein n=1 Tax=Liquorilactobacillus aquaticus DSM 21051 TaxID=1423725 RepID=A0A0R2CVE8_9LACO|nr:EAL domain-containing protein [Liquorilactobacillus aquaticus]KRM95381.1 diguanylate cyclase phosphodiesterase domain-containing protein [Liquorilactobacillus aquaticus DSM 21051]